MSDLSLTSVTFQPASQVQQTPPPAPPQPPKSQSDHKPANTSTSSRGPAVVLSGAFAQSTGAKRDTGDSQGAPPTGQHINHVI